MQDPPEKYMINVESSRSESDSGSCIGCPRKREWNGVEQMLLLQRNGGRRPYRRKYNDGFLFHKLRMQFRFRLLQLVGIADGRGVCSGIHAGSEGSSVGNPLCCNKEAQVHENYKNCILKARDIDSRVTGRSTGHPVRALRNQMTKTYLQKEQEGAAFEELELLTLGGLKKVVVDGDVQNGSVMAGQIAGMIKEKMSCKEVIEKLVQETDALLGGTEIYE